MSLDEHDASDPLRHDRVLGLASHPPTSPSTSTSALGPAGQRGKNSLDLDFQYEYRL